jgi:MEKHLA domain
MRRDLEGLLEASYRTVVGRDLRTDAGGDLYHAPAALLMHGNEADPVSCYANRAAQRLWRLSWDEFICLPSRLSAEPPVQAERDRLLARVRTDGFIDD